MKRVNRAKTSWMAAAFLMGFASTAISPASGAPTPRATNPEPVAGNELVYPALGSATAKEPIVIAEVRAVPGRAPVQRQTRARARGNGNTSRPGGNGNKSKPSAQYKPSTSNKFPKPLMPANCAVQPHLCF